MMNDELIARFFSNKCTPEEARQVADHLSANPGLLEKYLSEEEFMTLKEEGDLPESVSFQWLRHIHKEAVVENGRIKWMKRLAAAAVLGGVVLGASYLFRDSSSSQIADNIIQSVIPESEQERRENITKRILPVSLPDGSSVQLLPEAVIIFSKKFKENRSIYLEGEADFEVATDKLHAFTVYSDEVSTRVLGTSFHVKALSGDNFITIRLNTGKVVVSAEVLKKKTINDVILTPGKELRYDKKSMTATIRNFNKAAGNDAGMMVKAGNSNHNGAIKPDWYKFTNQPISGVLDQLSDYYGVAIYYYPADVKQINFEGKFENTDSLEKILTDITLPNNLKFTRNDSGYIIKRNQ
jgi:ferric-dicitrate binding protein FerR (iron transport regulator)